MRQVLSVVLLLSVAACGPPLRWQKPGIDDQTTANDLVGCRRAARIEAFQAFPIYYPWFPGWPYPLGRPYGSYDLDRSYTEDRLTSFCMRTKGYELVEVKPETTAPQAPAQPPVLKSK